MDCLNHAGYTTWEGRELYHPCTVCGKQYESKKALALHERTLHEGKPKRRQEYSCRFCGRLFRNYRAYCNHLGKIHGAQSENKFKRFLKPAKDLKKKDQLQPFNRDEQMDVRPAGTKDAFMQ